MTILRNTLDFTAFLCSPLLITLLAIASFPYTVFAGISFLLPSSLVLVGLLSFSELCSSRPGDTSPAYNHQISTTEFITKHHAVHYRHFLGSLRLCLCCQDEQNLCCTSLLW